MPSMRIFLDLKKAMWYISNVQSKNELSAIIIKLLSKLCLILQESDTFKMPMRFVFGVEATDDGNHLIPSSKGHLRLNSSFSISSPDAQRWLFNFCKDIKKQPFYQETYVSYIQPSCFIENLIQNMNRR